MKLVWKPLQQKRLLHIVGLILCITVGCLSFLRAYEESFHLYLSPQQVLSQEVRHLGKIRVGGILKENTLIHDQDSLSFSLSDESQLLLPVIFYGTPPRLLKEGQETIVMGEYKNGLLIAEEVLAKHDEYYRPQEKKGEACSYH